MRGPSAKNYLHCSLPPLYVAHSTYPCLQKKPFDSAPPANRAGVPPDRPEIQPENPPAGYTGYHEPILLEEILELAGPVAPRWIVDGTLGDGGHSLAFLERFPEARVLGGDQDAVMLERAGSRIQAAGYADRFEAIHTNFRHLPAQLDERGIRPDFMLLDLGVSMFHFRGAARGFSYEDAQSLDMRLDTHDPRRPTAADLINTAGMAELQRIFQEYGEERFAGRIARAIVESRPIHTARELAALIRRSVPHPAPARADAGGKSGRKSSYKKDGGDGGRKTGGGQIHPATRVFQALRIAVNDELGAAQAALGLDGLPARLAPGGRLAVISFHSLEDRVVKAAFREIGVPAHQRRAREAQYRILTRKPLPPSPAEIARNPASRSAKLRVLERSAETIP